LREAYRTPKGSIDYRCAAEPVTTYVSKGGRRENTVGKKCLCNALMANIGHPQTRNGKYIEQPLITSGNDLTGIASFLSPGAATFSARDVVAKLLKGFDSHDISNNGGSMSMGGLPYAFS
jgi:nitronate monooxygenase